MCIRDRLSSFNYLGFEISPAVDCDVENKFKHICGTIHRTLKYKTRKDTKLKFYKTIAVPVALYGSETWALSQRYILPNVNVNITSYLNSPDLEIVNQVAA